MSEQVQRRIADLRPGDQIAERDGYLLTVAAIVKRTPRTTTLRLTSMSAGLTFPASGIVQTFRNASKVTVVPRDGDVFHEEPRVVAGWANPDDLVRRFPVRASCGHVEMRPMRPSTRNSVAGRPLGPDEVLDAPGGRACAECEPR